MLLLRIAIDLMGGDSPPENLFQAVIRAAQQCDVSYSFIVIATKSVVNQVSSSLPPVLLTKHTGRIEFHIVADSISPGDEPLGAVRRKKGSSMVVGIRLLKKHHVDAFVSCGNTGALVASASLSLPMLPGVNRPALLAILPTKKGSIAVIDVGGNVSCKSHHLVQFALLGAAYQYSVHGIQNPRVGLLNIGIESKKGTAEVRQAYEILKESSQKGTSKHLCFIGNVEGREVFQGDVDVLVTDGFTGNVLLKTSEGVASFIFSSLHPTFDRSGTGEQKIALAEMQKRFSSSEYPGAILCGIDGIVIKCHGSSSWEGLFSSIKGAITLVQQKAIAHIKSQLQSVSTYDTREKNKRLS